MNWLMATYPSFASICKDEEQQRASLKAFDIAIKDLTDEELRTGCEHFVNNQSQFAPSVGSFKFAAKGLVTKDQAFRLALRKDLSNKAVKLAKERITSFDWSNQAEEKLRRSFMAEYEIVCKEILSEATNAQ